jgi:hypothetical protein
MDLFSIHGDELRLSMSFSASLNPDTIGGRLGLILWGLSQMLHGQTLGPTRTMLVVPDLEFDRLRQALFDEPQNRSFVLRPRRKRLDPTLRWFMMAGIRVVAESYAIEALAEAPRCPLLAPPARKAVLPSTGTQLTDDDFPF